MTLLYVETDQNGKKDFDILFAAIGCPPPAAGESG
jgi:hypothetical protein